MFAVDTKQSLDVAIVGGGIAGICLAIGLIKNNISTTIYESAHQFGEIGAGLNFGPSAIRAMQGIHPKLKEGFDRVATTNAWPELRNVWFDFRYGEGDKAGQHILRLVCNNAENYGSVHRARFLEETISLIPKGVAHFGKRVSAVEELEDGQTTLVFRDGTKATHACVIGCDGIHSEIRKFILGANDPAAQPVFSGKYCHRGLAPMSKAIEVLGEELAGNSQMYVGHHSHLLTMPIEGGKTFNVVAFGSCDTWEHENWVVSSSVKDIRKDFASFGEPVQRIIDMIQDTDIWALFNHLPARTYYKGNVAMIGDAAHATTPHQGSGAGMAVEDAFVLSSLLSKVQKPSQVQSALKAFNAVRRDRGNKLVATSYEAGAIWEMESLETGDDVEKIKQNASERMRWIWDEDLDAEIKEGLDLMEMI